MPTAIRESLQDAMEVAIRNVPRVAGKVFVFPDVSGSMQSPVTGLRKGSTTKVRCLDVAALVAAAVLRKNLDAEVIPFSDNESWIDSNRHGILGGSATETMKQWLTFQSRNPQARMVCIDIQPNGTTQAAEREDITNVGGFSDQVFSLIADVASGQASKDHWVTMIEKMSL